VKHTPSGGNVRIESARDRALEQSIVVRVRDTGPGIAADDAPHIFDRFYQGAGRSRGGSGLGLAFCKLAVELHGGSISVLNPGEAGAVVQFTLPAADHAVAAD
jgi:signal transduction histidine kinase